MNFLEVISMKLFKNYCLVAFLATALLPSVSVVSAMDGQPSVQEAQAYAVAVKSKFQALVNEIEQSPGRLRTAGMKANLERLFSANASQPGSFLNLYSQELEAYCGWEVSGEAWAPNSYRKAIFTAFITVAYGSLRNNPASGQLEVQSPGLFLCCPQQVAAHLNGPLKRGLRLSRGGTDILSRFFMELTKLDGALLLTPASNGKVRIDHWMEQVTETWYVEPTPGPQAPADDEEAEEIPAEAEADSREPRAPRQAWDRVDPEGLLSFENFGKVLILNQAGATVGVEGRSGSSFIFRLEPGVSVDVERRLTGQLEDALPVVAPVRPIEAHALDHAPKGLRKYLPGLLTTGGWLLFDALSAGGTPEGLLVASVLGLGSQLLLGNR
jgi:hypothetical protein